MYKPNAMYLQPSILDEKFTRDLKKLNETDCESAIRILRQRLKDLRDPDYYLRISVDDLQFSTRAFDVLKANKLETVMDILECGWQNIGNFRNAGPQTVNEIKNKVDRIVAYKNKIRGLAGLQLALAISNNQ